MQHFFVTPEQVGDQFIQINGSDVNHIKNVLRMKIEEKIEISDGNNKKYLGEILEMNAQGVLVRILEEFAIDTELSNDIYLFQGFPKSDKMEWIVQKAVELGAKEIIPVKMKRSIVKLDEKKAKKKIERYNTIAQSAAKQSARGVVPVVRDLMSLKEAFEYAKALDVVLLPYELAEGMEETRRIIGEIKQGQSVGVFIGPEGGFDVEEINWAKQFGVYPITLGKRILRTETAGVTVLSILMYHLEK